ncbi:MAG TPA: CPBP family intramembrane glutamic endopeptidase [Capsulimonadaceae bacterium]|nr:CPBP family intramembrane glutamic endopeptidase [Capsulimonadaceae bacterium]
MAHLQAHKRRRSDRSGQDRPRAGRGQRKRNSDFVTPSVVFVVGAAISAFLFYENPYLGNFETYRLVNCGLLLFVPLCLILLFLRQSPAHFGVARGDRRQGLKWAGIAWLAMLPLLIFTATRPDFQTYYGESLSQALGYGARYAYSPYLRPHVAPAGLLYYEMGTGFYLFCWEFFFRGFLLFGLARARFIGPIGAIVLQAIPFTLLHWSLVPAASKPPLEIASAFFGALALGALAWRTRSFVYGFLVHWAVSITLDLFLLLPVLMYPKS